jgi:transcriptional regulator with XRE-family HTH domain
MWLDNLKELKKEKNLSTKRLAELSNLPEKTVTRILSGQTANPYLDTLDRLATALGCSIGDIVAGTKAVVGTEQMPKLQEEIENLISENTTIIAEKDLLLAENSILKDEVKTLNSKIELLTMQLSYKDEIIALHKIIEQERNK